MIREIQRNRTELLEQLELYYRVVVLGQPLPGEDEKQ